MYELILTNRMSLIRHNCLKNKHALLIVWELETDMIDHDG